MTYMKKLKKFLIFIIFGQIGACLGHMFAIYNNYLRHPDLYAMYSAPWYVDLIPTAVFTGIGVVITGIVYFILGYIAKKREQRQSEKDYL